MSAPATGAASSAPANASASGAPAPHDALPRRIGLWTAVAIVVGTTIGSGIFRSPAGIADRLPGPLPMMAIWVLGGLLALCGALTIAEVGGAYPATGGIYAYIREGWGRLPAFLYGWTELILVRAASLGAIAITFAEYTIRVLGIDPTVEPYASYARYTAAVAIALVGSVNIVGVSWGSLVQNVTSVAKYFGLALIVVIALAIGLPETGGANFTPAVPAGSFTMGAFGLALVSVLWAYDGWSNLSYIGGEVMDPRRNIPRALIIGMTAIIAIYLLANIGYLSVLTIEEMRTSRLVAADVAQRLVGYPGVAFVAVTVMLSTFGTLNGSIMTSPRIFYAMADDRLLFKGIAKVHPRFQTPWVAIGIAMVLGIAFVLSRSFEQLADTFVTAIIPFYAMAVAAVYVLRKRAGYNPSFRTPGYPVVPALFILSVIYLLANALIDERSRMGTAAVLGVILVGVPVYYLTVGRRKFRPEPRD
ncbi:MAG TPA: amino acid permease [Gemmatimonadaceae bacterium]|nr:amino acid permease [Gemmatimonadaceae bacterium]